MRLNEILLLSFLVGSQCTKNGNDCFEKEKSLGALDYAKDAVEKVKHLLPDCIDDHPSANTSECGKKEKARAFLEIATDMIAEAKKNYPTCPDIVDPVIIPTVKSIDCSDVLQQGYNTSGVYRIWPNSTALLNDASILVYCDMDTDGGGWTVIQRRGGNYTRQNFYQDWDAYKKGFGDIKGEFWLGNDNIYALSNQAKYKLRVDLESVEGYKKYAEYKTFRIENEEAMYKLRVAQYSGNAGDCLEYDNNKVFCTKDRPNGKSFEGVSCVQSRGTGWWFESCNKANLNGLPRTGDPSNRKNLYWKEWQQYTSLASADMKLRRT